MPCAGLKFHTSAIKARLHEAQSASPVVSESVATVLHDMFGLSDGDISKALLRTQGARTAGVKLRFEALAAGRIGPLLPK